MSNQPINADQPSEHGNLKRMLMNGWPHLYLEQPTYIHVDQRTGHSGVEETHACYIGLVCSLIDQSVPQERVKHGTPKPLTKSY